jgi:hypothetical protein
MAAYSNADLQKSAKIACIINTKPDKAYLVQLLAHYKID